MARGDLFRPFSLRFSMKNEQHVKILQRFNDKKLNGGRGKIRLSWMHWRCILMTWKIRTEPKRINCSQKIFGTAVGAL